MYTEIHIIVITLVNHVYDFDGLHDHRDIIANLDPTVKRGIHCLLLDRDAPDCLIHRLDELAPDVRVATYNFILEVREGDMQLFEVLIHDELLSLKERVEGDPTVGSHYRGDQTFIHSQPESHFSPIWVVGVICTFRFVAELL